MSALSESAADESGAGPDKRVRRRRPSCPPPRSRLRPGCGRLGDLGEELVVALGGADLVDEQLEALALLEGVQHPAELPHLLELVAVEEQLLVTRARRLDVDRRVDPPLRQAPVEPELHVPGALELLE